MNKDLEAYLQDPEPVPDASYTSLQRQALAEVLHLSSDVVGPLESQIESEYEATRKRVQEQFDSEKHRIEQNEQAQSEKFRNERDARVEDIQAEYEGQLSAIKVDTQRKRKKINQSAVELEQKAEKERQEQIMVAEFVAEGAVTKHKQKQLEAKAAGDDARRYLDSISEQAGRLLTLYRQSGAAKAAEAEAPSVRDQATEERYESCQALLEQRLEALKNLRTSQLFVGARPVLLAGGLTAIVLTFLGVLYQLEPPGLPSTTIGVPVAIGLCLLLIGFGGRLLWRRAKRHVRRANDEFQEALVRARAALEHETRLALENVEREFRASVERKEAELKRARDTLESTKANITKQRSMSLQEIELYRREALDRLKAKRDAALQEAKRGHEQQLAEGNRRSQGELAGVQERYDKEMA
ncbi:MAG: hypothetical protein ACYTAS_11720, partial [Planctomycetota bacterium]